MGIIDLDVIDEIVYLLQNDEYILLFDEVVEVEVLVETVLIF